MEINNWSNKEIIKLLTARAGITQKKLSVLLCENFTREYSSSNFYHKILKNNLKLEELQAICEVLGYNLLLEKKEK